MPQSDDDILDVEQAAKFLKISPDTLKKLARERKIPSNKIGRQWRFPRAQLQQFVGGGKAVRT